MAAMNRVTVNIIVVCCTVLIAVAGCGTACRCCRSESTSIASAPERVAIDGREYTLNASAWRDFQPVAPRDGQPLVVVVKLTSAEPIPTPADLAIDHVWVLNGKKEWSAAPEPGTREPGATRLEQAVRGGPKWGPGIKVDVVVRLKQGKQTFLVRKAGVDIKRTD